MCCSRWGGFKLETSFEWSTTKISAGHLLFLICINDLDDNNNNNNNNLRMIQTCLEGVTMMVTNNIYKMI